MKNLYHVLMVDDDETTIFLNNLFLDGLGLDLEVNEAMNGEEALEFLEVHLNDPKVENCLVILDVEMPVMDGWQFLEVFEQEFSKELRDKVTLGILSMHNNDDIKKKAKAFSTVDACLTKPLSESQFKELIAAHYPKAFEDKATSE